MSTSSIQSGLQTISKEFAASETDVDKRVFGEKVGFIGKLFGCWHEDMSRPFSQDEVSYRSCLKCGARKQFDSQALRTFGGFYFPPVVKPVNFG